MPRQISGTVTSTKQDKTIIITSHTQKTHPLYRKQYTETTNFMAHDEKNEAQVGDKVEIVECRPISARKHFKLSKIIDKPLLREDALKAIKVEEKAKEQKEEAAS